MYMNIDSKKILDSKTPRIDPLTESYNLTVINQSPKNIINFMSLYKASSKESILENLNKLCDINSDITFSYFNNVLEVAELPDRVLDEYKTHISSLLESRNSFLDSDYCDKLNESISKIDSKIERNNDMNVIKEEMLMNLAVDRIRKSYVFESYLEDDLEVLIYNINTSPETIADYEKIIRQIKVSKTSEYMSSFPMLLIKNTELIKNLNIRVTGDVLDLLTSMPTVIADKLITGNMSQTIVKSYIKIFDKQIAEMYSALKNNDPRMYQLYSTYVKKLIEAKRTITEKYESVDESCMKENIAEMQPDIVLYDEGVIEDVIAEMEDTLADIIFDPGDEIDEAKFESLIRLTKTYEAAIVRKAGYAINKGTQNVVNKAKATQTNANRATLPIKKAADPIINMFNNTINKMKDMDKKERTERIITGEYRLKLINIIKKGIIGITTMGGAATGAKVAGAIAVGVITTPSMWGAVIVGAISLLVGVAIDKKIDAKHRKRILADLENELDIVNEKLEDAKSDGDRKSKYELMRIQQKLKKDIERIKFNLD